MLLRQVALDLAAEDEDRGRHAGVAVNLQHRVEEHIGRVLRNGLAYPFLARHAAGNPFDIVTDEQSAARHGPSSNLTGSSA